jgi:hypothetical protein
MGSIDVEDDDTHTTTTIHIHTHTHTHTSHHLTCLPGCSGTRLSPKNWMPSHCLMHFAIFPKKECTSCLLKARAFSSHLAVKHGTILVGLPLVLLLRNSSLILETKGSNAQLHCMPHLDSRFTAATMMLFFKAASPSLSVFSIAYATAFLASTHKGRQE